MHSADTAQFVFNLVAVLVVLGAQVMGIYILQILRKKKERLKQWHKYTLLILLLAIFVPASIYILIEIIKGETALRLLIIAFFAFYLLPAFLALNWAWKELKKDKGKAEETQLVEPE